MNNLIIIEDANEGYIVHYNHAIAKAKTIETTLELIEAILRKDNPELLKQLQ